MAEGARTPAEPPPRPRRTTLRRTAAGVGWLGYCLVVAVVVYSLLVLSGR